jgi:hypothetical protein
MKVRGPWAAAVVIALLAGIGIAGLFYIAQEQFLMKTKLIGEGGATLPFRQLSAVQSNI